MFAGLNAILAAVGTAIALGLALFLGGKRQGRKDEEIKQIRRRAEQAREVQELQDEVDKMSDADVDREHSRWVRPKDPTD